MNKWENTKQGGTVVRWHEASASDCIPLQTLWAPGAGAVTSRTEGHRPPRPQTQEIGR